MDRTLEGIRVLDFGRYVAGPLCAAMLGDLGADVIRVEKRRGGEDRYLCPLNPDADESEAFGAIYAQTNRNKRCLTYSPTKPGAKELLKKLVESADIVVANLPDKALVAMGIDYDSLCAIKPDIILTKASAYGSVGPYADKLGFDATGQAMSGSMYLSGFGDEPTRAYPPWVDNSTAFVAAYGTLAALHARDKTGEGQVVESSLLGTALAINADPLIEQAVLGIDRKAMGNRSTKGAPSDSAQCSDGEWVMVQAVGSALFERWATLMGRPEIIDEPRFSTDVSRAEHAEELSGILRDWCKTRPSQEVMDTLESNAIPCAPIYSPAQVLEDPHVKAAGLISALPYEGMDEPVPLISTPVTFSKMENNIRFMAPKLGEHTESILTELGYSQSEISKLIENKTV